MLPAFRALRNNPTNPWKSYFFKTTSPRVLPSAKLHDSGNGWEHFQALAQSTYARMKESTDWYLFSPGRHCFSGTSCKWISVPRKLNNAENDIIATNDVYLIMVFAGTRYVLWHHSFPLRQKEMRNRVIPVTSYCHELAALESSGRPGWHCFQHESGRCGRYIAEELS